MTIQIGFRQNFLGSALAYLELIAHHTFHVEVSHTSHVAHVAHTSHVIIVLK
jgi:hypothetical protein